MRKRVAESITLAVILAMIPIVVGCAQDPKSGAGFTLPEGDVARGQLTFVELRCHACHTVAAIEFGELSEAKQTMIALGGEKPNVVTYGELVTSIINPSHRFAANYAEEQTAENGRSKMRIYNDEMTVTQLTDLVTFLESHYEVRAYQPTPYMPYY